jgi:hypothetical protein
MTGETDELSRRRIIQTMGTIGGVLLSGCTDDSPDSTTPNQKTRIKFEPQNPQVGQNVQLTGNINLSWGNSPGDIFFFWSFSDDMSIDASGKRTIHSFDEDGRHLIRMLAVDEVILDEYYNATPTQVESISQLTGKADSDTYVRHSKSISVAGLPNEQINVESDLLNITLKGAERVVPANHPAILQFSAANLRSDKTLTVQLLIEVPTGLSVRSTSFNQGQGQYLSTYSVSSGDVAGESIRIVANSPGTYTIRGRTVYGFEGETQSTESQSITVKFKNRS